MKTKSNVLNYLFIIFFLPLLWSGYSCKPSDSKSIVHDRISEKVDSGYISKQQYELQVIVKDGVPLWVESVKESVPNYYSGRIIDNSDNSTSIKKTRPDNTYEQLIETEMVMGKSASFTTKTFGLPIGVKELGLPTLY